MARENLYSGKEYFFLIISGSGYKIDEPVNWGNILIELIRDAVLYGFSWEFVGGDVELVFKWGDGGGELLEAHYELYKGDAKAQLDFGILNSATRERQFLGNINFNDYHKNKEGIVVTVEKVAFEALLRTRFDTPISLNTTEDLDGNTIAILPTKTMQLHSKEIVKFSQAKREDGQLPQDYLIDQNNTVPANQGSSILKWLQPDTTNITLHELDDFSAEPLGVTNDDPTTIGTYQYKAAEAGFMEVEFGFGMWYIPTFGFFVYPVDFTPFMQIKRAGTVILIEYFTNLKQTADNPYGNLISGTATFSQNVIPGDEVYIGLRMDAATPFIGVMIQGWSNSLTFKQLTVAPASLVQGYRLYDVLTRLVYVMTGKNDAVVSEYYGTGGPGEKAFITNGYAIRNFSITVGPANVKPVQLSFKDLVDGLQMMDNIGVGYDLDADGDDVVYIDKCINFFGGKTFTGIEVITELKNVFDYSEANYKAGTYNQIDLGFEKFPDAINNKNLNGGINTLDEFNTAQTWQTPITTYKNKLSRKCKLITSGYSIEDIRREQFKQSPSTSMSEDDSVFLIAYTDDIVYSNIGFQFFAVDQSITFSKPVNLDSFDSFGLAGVTLNSVGQTIDRKKDPSGLSFYLSDPVTDETAVGNLTIYPYIFPGAGGLFAERNQNFELSNVISPATVYNARHTPKHALYSWLPFTNSFLWGKNNGEVIKNTTSKNNREFTSTLLHTAPYTLDSGYIEVKENADISVADAAAAGKIHLGVTQNFKVQLPYSTVTLINTEIRRVIQPRKAFIVVPDLTGRKWLALINSMKYNPVTQTAEFETFKVGTY